MKEHLKKYTYKEKISLLSLITMVVTLSCLMVALNFIIINIEDFQKNIVNSIKNKSLEQIDYFIDRVCEDAEENVKSISKDVENTATTIYNGDLDRLKEDLDNDNYYELSKSIEPHIRNVYLDGVKTDGNTLFVATYKGIICDFSYKTSEFNDSIVDKNTYRHWDTFLDDCYNKELCKNAIDSLLKKDTDCIIWQYNKPEDDTIPMYKNIDLDDIRDIYLEYGISGLKSYELLVPKYITKTGDIFGQEDIVQGVRYDNYKIIVVQRINLYDQLVNICPELNNDESIDKIVSQYETIMYNLYILGLIITIGFVAAIIHSCNCFNKNHIK